MASLRLIGILESHSSHLEDRAWTIVFSARRNSPEVDVFLQETRTLLGDSHSFFGVRREESHNQDPRFMNRLREQ